MADLTIWTLNEATSLIRGHEDEYADALSAGGRHEVRFGSRDGFHQLMHEGDRYGGPPTDEYFIPIALKCLGRRYRDTPGGEAGLLLEGIRAEHRWFFENAADFEAYWEPRRGPLGMVQMSTPDFLGYYDLLPRDSANVLVGYSQGGLVARYLAFLDEYVFKEGRVAGVITVHSPNHGSPLAFDTLPTLPASKERIADALVEAVLTIASFNAPLYARMHAHLRHLEFDHLYRLISSVFDDLEARGDTIKGQEQALRGAAASALKWLSGLQPLPFATAFNDLNPGLYDNPFSVLALLHRFPAQRVLTGAIVGVNGRLDDMMRSLFGGLISLLLLAFVKPLGHELDRNLKLASTVYAQKVLNEPYTGIKQLPELLRNYTSPILIDGQQIGAYAHDFIVPGVSQVLPGAQLGNLLNPDANHDSGKDRSERPGRVNAAAIRTLLGKLGKQLRDVPEPLVFPAPPAPGEWAPPGVEGSPGRVG